MRGFEVGGWVWGEVVEGYVGEKVRGMERRRGLEEWV